MPRSSRNEIYEAVIRKMVNQAMEAQENAFLQAHEQDTDEELIGYLQFCAAELGDSPRYKEVIGWKLIRQRFGKWNAALQKAGLRPAPACPVSKLPRIAAETQKQKERYRRIKAEKQLRNRQRLEKQAQRKNKTQDN